MKVTLVATVLNEAGNIRPFLEAILAQTRAADEIVVTDGGSTDGTLEILREQVRSGGPLRLLVEPGANIARGRNLAIGQASSEIIAVTDAGCRVDRKWLEEITAPFCNPAVDVSGGVSRTEATTLTQLSFGVLTLTDHGEAKARWFDPSSRCVAFRKSAWEKAGGYPEELDCAEDSLFNQRLHASGARFVFSPDALVYWLPPRSLREAAWKFYLYGRGDGRAGLSQNLYARILLKAVLATGLAAAALYSSFFLALLALSCVAYYLRTLWVNRKRGSLAVNSLVFLHRVSLDAARLAGFLLGRVERAVIPKFRHLR